MRRLVLRLFIYLGILALLTGCFHIQLMGSVTDATLTITPLRGGSSVAQLTSINEQYWINAMGQEDWDALPELVRLTFVGMAFLTDKDAIDPDAFYLVEVAGGEDNDAEANGALDSDPQRVFGSWHLLVKGQRIIDGNLKVSILTEAIYQYLKADIPTMSDMELMTRLDELAALVIASDIADQPGVTYNDDVMRWNTSLNRGAYPGDDSLLNRLASAVYSGETDDAVLLDDARAIIENRFGLNGSWSGQQVEGASGFDAKIDLTIVDNMIASVANNDSPGSVTATITSSSVLLYSGAVFNVAFSDGRSGRLLPDSSGRYFVLTDDEMVMAVLELDSDTRPDYNLDDLQGSFSGGGVAANGLLGLNANVNCTDDPAGVYCDGLSSVGFGFGIAGSQSNGVYQTTAFDDDAELEVNPAWLVLSNDKQFLGVLYCDDGYSFGNNGCNGGYGPFVRQ
jgi:hypothetical protein